MDQYQNWRPKSESEFVLFLKKRREVLINTLFIFANILVFLVTELTGSSMDNNHMVEMGAAFTPLIQEGHEYYRLFTCMFLHFGLPHLGNNMLVLLFLGDSLEQEVGKLRYALIYLAGGLGASCFSYYLEVVSGNAAVSAGASGAVFAVTGALIYVVIRNKGRLGELTSKKIIFLAALTLYLGITSTGVDNAAHLGGLVMGFLVSVLLYHKKK